MTGPETPDSTGSPLLEARQLAARVQSGWHVDAAPEFAYPGLSRAQAVQAAQTELAAASAAYHKCLIDHRDELARYPEFAADYGEIDNPAPCESRWSPHQWQFLPPEFHDDPPF